MLKLPQNSLFHKTLYNLFEVDYLEKNFSKSGFKEYMQKCNAALKDLIETSKPIEISLSQEALVSLIYRNRLTNTEHYKKWLNEIVTDWQLSYYYFSEFDNDCLYLAKRCLWRITPKLPFEIKPQFNFTKAAKFDNSVGPQFFDGWVYVKFHNELEQSESKDEMMLHVCIEQKYEKFGEYKISYPYKGVYLPYQLKGEDL